MPREVYQRVRCSESRVQIEGEWVDCVVKPASFVSVKCRVLHSHVYLRTLLRREHRMHFAAVDSQGSVRSPELLLWDALCLTHLCALSQSTWRTLLPIHRFSVLNCTTRYSCSRQHARPESILRMLFLHQHSLRMWGSSQPFPPLKSSYRFRGRTSSHSPSFHQSHWLFVPVRNWNQRAPLLRSCVPRCSRTQIQSPQRLGALRGTRSFSLVFLVNLALLLML